MNRSPRDPFVKEDEMSQGSDVNEVSEQRLEEIESLFVQTAHALATSGGSTITLRGVSPSRCTSPIGPSGRSGTCRTSIS
jgi:hypothetical protein